MASISILTATYNSGATIAGLIASLEVQSDADFEWVVIDGGSGDDTLARVEAAKLARKVVSSGPDFGVYDALNKGLRAASGDYYLVVGSDDTLTPEAVASYRAAIAASPGLDLVTAAVRSGDRLCVPSGRRPWLHGMQAYISAHSVGVLIRRSLHERFGLYSRKYPIGADQWFIKRAVQGGASLAVADFCAGSFGSGGMSSVDTVGTLTEFFRVQLATESGKALQVLLFLLRLAKNYRRGGAMVRIASFSTGAQEGASCPRSPSVGEFDCRGRQSFWKAFASMGRGPLGGGSLQRAGVCSD